MKKLILVISILLPVISFAHVEHDVIDKGQLTVSTRPDAYSEKMKSLLDQAKAEKNEKLFAELLHSMEQEHHQSALTMLYIADAQQYLHQFDKALNTLDKISELPGAMLMRASILLTQGKNAEAEKACKRMLGKLHELHVVTCYTHAISLNGRLEVAYEMLSEFLRSHKDIAVKDAAWAYSVLAEMSERRGQYSEAEQYYLKTLKVEPDNIAVRLAYVDILLNQKRFKKVRTATKKYLQHDAMLLRYVRALNIEGDPTTNDYFCELKRRVLHYPDKEQHIHFDTKSEYQLYFTDKPQLAVTDIKRHWRSQKMPRDARLFAKIGKLAGDFEVLDEVRSWKEKNKLEDLALGDLLQ